VLNSLTWTRVAECTHPTELRAAFSEEAIVWREAGAEGGTGYAASRLPLVVPSSEVNPDKPHPRVGVGLILWSHDGRYIATRNDNMPRAIWIWDGATLLLHSVVLQQQPVREAAWHPSQHVLALCTGGGIVYLWSPNGCRTAPLPAAHEMSVRSLRWRPNGDALLLIDRDSGRYCVSFLNVPGDASPGSDDAMQVGQG